MYLPNIHNNDRGNVRNAECPKYGRLENGEIKLFSVITLIYDYFVKFVRLLANFWITLILELKS